MDTVTLWLTSAAAVIFVAWLGTRLFRQGRREHFIADYPFPAHIVEKIREKYPDLTDEQLAKVLRGLRDYFHICNDAQGQFASMPSRIVDDAWHEFILDTKAYREFCKGAFGTFLDHMPAEAMLRPVVAQRGIQVTWKHACLRDRIDMDSPERLPLLFALDGELDVPNGFRYVLNCGGKSSARFAGHYCASHINTNMADGLCGAAGGCGAG